MKTKDLIVQKLLDNGYIDAEEAVILLKEAPVFQQFTPNIVQGDGKVPYHTICGCDVCNCILANKMVDPRSSANWTTDYNYQTSQTDKKDGQS